MAEAVAQGEPPAEAARQLAAQIARAAVWIEGMQSTNGGWGAFDIDNNAAVLNSIPFADHGALLDPPTVDVTARCLSFLAQLGYPQPRYAHIPVITNAAGQKLSKQNLAPAISAHERQGLLLRALDLLGQQPPAELADASPDEVLSWATTHWQLATVPAVLSLPADANPAP